MINFAGRRSSAVKGETLLRHRVKNLQAMRPDVVVIRHHASGAPHLLAERTTARGDQRRRRHARAPDAGAARRVHHPAAPRASSRGCTVAIVRRHRAQPGGAVERATCSGRWAPRCASPGRATLLPAAAEALGGDGVRPHRAGARGRRRGDDAARAARADVDGSFFPSTREYSRDVRAQRGAAGAGQAGRHRDAPGADEPGRRDRPADVADGAAPRDPRAGRDGVAVRMAVLYLLLASRPETTACARAD